MTPEEIEKEKLHAFETHSLREIMESTKDVPIKKGGLAFLIGKIVYDIEKLQKNYREQA